jgi:ribosomal protein S6--L-glutamate ligase
MWYAYKILKALEGSVYMPIRPESVIISHNKFLKLVALKEAGLPIPKTFLAISRQTLESMLDSMKYPVVMKLLYGSLGKGVMFADSKESAKSLMDTLERFREPIFLEEFVKNPGKDIRAFVLGDKVLGAEVRIAQEAERRTNIGIGGMGKPLQLDARTSELAVKAAKALGTSINGIDIIKGPKGPVIIEGNVNVHFEGLTKVLKINVAKAIVEYVRDEVTSSSGMIGRYFGWLIEKRRI